MEIPMENWGAKRANKDGNDLRIDLLRDLSPAADVLSELISREQAVLTAEGLFNYLRGSLLPDTNSLR
jgi:hypothetical protein